MGRRRAPEHRPPERRHPAGATGRRRPRVVPPGQPVLRAHARADEPARVEHQLGLPGLRAEARTIGEHSRSVETKRTLPPEEAYAMLAGEDHRPLLVLRECMTCNGTDDALMTRKADNERTMLLSRWFHCVKLPPGRPGREPSVPEPVPDRCGGLAPVRGSPRRQRPSRPRRGAVTHGAVGRDGPAAHLRVREEDRPAPQGPACGSSTSSTRSTSASRGSRPSSTRRSRRAA